ncbi:hypothetical protein GCM10027290_62490 [Micromonospora sonneratiae]|uniref:Uncharacterized protein n=1 Tax=Micromonospora sonneratiae TaxID=1184706 RepID=A0ABW3YEP1_9ACTN
MTSSETENVVPRRGVLRTAATATGAAVAATVAVTAATAAPASASNGDPVKLGQENAGTGRTTLRSAAPGGASTLEVANPDGVHLRLQPGGNTSTVPGAFLPTFGGFSIVGTDPGTGAVQQRHAFTAQNATMPVPVPPTRVLDTRTAAGRSRLLAGQDEIDSSGRAIANAFLVVHLGGIVEYGDGLLGNITVANTAGAGFATVWGRGETPTSSTINWWAAGQLLSNGYMTQIGPWDETYPDVVAIYVKSPTVVILDVTALLVYVPEQSLIGSTALRSASAGARQQRLEQVRNNLPASRTNSRPQR